MKQNELSSVAHADYHMFENSVCSGNLHQNEEKHVASSCFFLPVGFRVAPRPQS